MTANQFHTKWKGRSFSGTFLLKKKKVPIYFWKVYSKEREKKK